jgi:FMN phosphatase YigB (HAD superfamily)
MNRQIIFDFYNTLYNPKTKKMFRGSFVLLKKLSQDYKLILVTTFSPERVDILVKLNLDNFFSKIIICPQKNQSIFKKLKRQSNETIVIGDREEEEIAFGLNLGLTVIKVNPNLENPTITIRKSLGERVL